MSRVLILLLAGLLVLLYLLANAPARLIHLALPGDEVILQGFSGSLWQGHASRALVAVPAGHLALGAVSWKLSPVSLLLMAPQLDIESEWGSQTASGKITLRNSSSLDLEDFNGSVSAELIKQVMPLMVSGNLSAQLEHLKIRDGRPVAGQGRLVWQNAAWNSPQGLMNLGSYGLDFEQPEGSALTGEVVTIAGPVNADGEISLDGNRYGVHLTIGSKQGLDSQLNQALSLIAQPLPQGGYQVDLDGEI
jgi:general secretion pathway protein N